MSGHKRVVTDLMSFDPAQGARLLQSYGLAWAYTGLLIYQSTDLPIYRSSDLAIYRSIDLPIYRSTNLPIYQSIDLPIYRSTDLPIYRSSNLPIYRSTYLLIYQSTDLPSADCVPILEMGYSDGNDVGGLRISYIVVGDLVKG